MKNQTDILKPIQPYFVLRTSHYYKQVLMNYGISHFYEYTLDCQEEDHYMAVPDGCVDIMFQDNGSGVNACIAGTVLSHMDVKNESTKQYFGVRFLPSVLPAIADCSMEDLVNNTIDLKEVAKCPDLLERVAEAKGLNNKISVFMKGYVAEMARLELDGREYDSRHNLAEAVRHYIYAAGGEVRIKELEEYTGYTARYMNKVFHEIVGVSPKLFCKITKLQRMIQWMNQSDGLNLADFAVDYGYYDQSHFIKDFKEFTAMTPKQYTKMLKEKDYRHRLIVSECRY